jgi:hypothetical protein
MGFRISAAAAIAALAILGVAHGAAASNSDSWSDPAGDSKTAADLTGIAAASGDDGKITFTLTYGNRPAGLTDDDQVQIWLDADESGSTGVNGFDYILVLEKAGAFLKQATPGGPVDTPQTTVAGSTDGRTASVNRSEVGNPVKFDFFVRTLAKSDLSADEAPDASDRVFVFSLTAPRPTQILYAFSPKTPKAGKTFTAAVLLVKLDDGTVAVFPSLTCKGTLNGKRLPATATPLSCVWKLPKSAKGKRLVISIDVSNHGSKGTFGPWKFKVR